MGTELIRPTLFLLHALGSSAREWEAVSAALGPDHDCVALDLPGFGDAAGRPDTDVAAMLDGLADTIRAHRPTAWLAVGHSMGGKLATLIAARAEGGEPGLSGLAGVVLLAASPPAPEPMAEERRRTMLGWAANGPIGQQDAEHFLAANIAAPLAPAVMARATRDVMRAAPGAWRSWLLRGSREDWSSQAGVIAAPALLIAGAEDGDLGAAAQARLNLPHYRRGRLETIPGAAHMLPLEQPNAVARLIAGHWQQCRAHALPADMAALLASDRVSARTRALLMDRRFPPVDDAPSCLSPEQRNTLDAIVAQILPGVDAGAQIARRIDVALASGRGDGWRFAALPPDREAWAAGLDALQDLTRLTDPAQEQRLRAVAEAGFDGGRLSAAQMRLWFEDARAEAVRTWLALPSTMARIGYDGFANGGDGARLQGFVETRADHVEPWQPRRSQSA